MQAGDAHRPVGNPQEQVPIAHRVAPGGGVECLTQHTGIREDVLEEVIPALSRAKRERSGGSSLPGRGVCRRK